MVLSAIPDAASAQLLSSTPIFLVQDVRQAAAEYQDRFGFSLGFFYGEPPFYASVSRDGIALHFRAVEGFARRAHPEPDTLDLSIAVRDVDGLYAEYEARGAKIFYGPVSQPYGQREFYVEDSHGYRIAFAQRIDN